MKIGVDFDGVIADSVKLKQRLFRQELGLQLRPEECCWEKAREKGVTREQYRQVVEGMIYGTELCLEIEPVPGSIDVIRKLKEEGNEIYIVTSRQDNQAEYAARWMDDEIHRVGYEKIINTCDKPKGEVCIAEGIGVLVEDSPGKLQDVAGLGIRAILLEKAYNRGLSIPEGAERAADWNEIYEMLNPGSD